MEIYDWVTNTVKTTPEAPFLYFRDQVWSYQQVDQIVYSIGKGLLELNVTPGDRIAIFSGKVPETIFCYLACFRIGAILASIDNGYKAEEFSTDVKKVTAKLLIAQDTLYNRVKDRQDTPSIKHTVIIGNSKPFKNTLSLDELITKGNNSSKEIPKIANDDKALILYTSGSTANPKAVVHCHKSLLHMGESMAREYQFSSTSRYLFSKEIGFMSCFGMAMMPTLASGGSLILIPEINANAILNAIEKYKITNTHIAPINLIQITHVKNYEKVNYSSIKIVSLGGDSVPVDSFNKLNALIPNKVIVNCGMTEITCYAHTQAEATYHYGLIGNDFAGVTTQIQNENGAQAKSNELGEICVKSDCLFSEYWENPDENKKSFVNGWFRTNDLGRRDEDGTLWFVDRLKNVIKGGNENVSPLEVENVLHAHEGVLQVCVVGAYDKSISGDIVVAFISLDKKHQVTKEALLTHTREHLADYKVPRHIVFLDKMLFTASGKVNRKILKKRADELFQ